MNDKLTLCQFALQDTQYEGIWLTLDGVFKENIKEALLQSLADKSTVVRNQISNLIASIAAIEIPRGEWGTLITSLCTNANHE